MCILMYPVASEMMKEHITYFHSNKANRKIWKQPVILPGDLLPGDRATESWNWDVGQSHALKSFYGEPQYHSQQQEVKDCCFHLHLLSRMCLKYGKDIIKFLRSVFYLLFTRLDWHDMICALRGHNKLLAGQFAESRGWLCLVPVSRN